MFEHQNGKTLFPEACFPYRQGKSKNFPCFHAGSSSYKGGTPAADPGGAGQMIAVLPPGTSKKTFFAAVEFAFFPLPLYISEVQA